MSNMESGEIVLLLLIGILILAIFCFLVSTISLIPPIRKYAQENKSNLEIVALVLGIAACLSIFIAVTRWEADTSIESPPHGVVWGINEGSGAVFINSKTDEELLLDDTILKNISNERFLRYLLPPPFRHSCSTSISIGCKWADIDISGFEDKYEWLDFFLRIIIGMFSGLATGMMVWLYTGNKKELPISAAG